MVAIAVDYQLAFKNAGVDFSKLADQAVNVVLNTSGMKFVKGGEVLASLPIPPGKVSELASKFDASNPSHQTMKASLNSVVNQLEKKLLGPAISPGVTTASPFFKNNEPEAAPAPVAMGLIQMYPADQMINGPALALLNAEKLFQPVKGTSANSRYFVVGLGNGIKVAARFKKPGKLSVRIEGTSFAKLSVKIQEAGVFGPAFAGSFTDNYASMHLAVDGKKEVQRVIGAILGSMAPFIGHPTPDLQPLMDAA